MTWIEAALLAIVILAGVVCGLIYALREVPDVE